MKSIFTILFLTLTCIVSAQCYNEHQVKFDSIDIQNWMNVPFVKGRLATEEDVEEGRAIFKREGKGHYPIDMEIPSLAYLTDVRTQKKNMVVIIQAEMTDGTKFIGFRALNGGGHGICQLEDLELIEKKSVE